MMSKTTGSETSRLPGFGDMSALLTTESKLWRTFGIDLPLRFTAEILSFGGRRLHAQAEHVKALGRCGSPAEGLKLHADFVMRTVTDYQREADTISRDVLDGVVPAAGKAA